MTTPLNLEGLYASSLRVDSEKKWVVAVIGGDILLFGSHGSKPTLAIAAEDADVLKFFREGRCISGSGGVVTVRFGTLRQRQLAVMVLIGSSYVRC